jgi:hypothetical protein
MSKADEYRQFASDCIVWRALPQEPMALRGVSRAEPS